jgi:hypothetical protein
MKLQKSVPSLVFSLYILHQGYVFRGILLPRHPDTLMPQARGGWENRGAGFRPQI